jgi:hypothetical protein
MINNLPCDPSLLFSGAKSSSSRAASSSSEDDKTASSSLPASALSGLGVGRGSFEKIKTKKG